MKTKNVALIIALIILCVISWIYSIILFMESKNIIKELKQQLSEQIETINYEPYAILDDDECIISDDLRSKKSNCVDGSTIDLIFPNSFNKTITTIKLSIKGDMCLSKSKTIYISPLKFNYLQSLNNNISGVKLN